MKDYLFTSNRLGFRKWNNEDIDDLYELCSDEKVMEHFPSVLSKKECEDFLQRLQDHYEKNGHSYFAVEVLDTGENIGFIGLALQDYESEFTPAVDVGYRLKTSAWGKGYATEGAERCLKHAFEDLNLDRVIATCVEQNIASEKVMKKIGMEKKGHFNHPKLKDNPDYRNCIWYELLAQNYNGK